MTRLFGVLIGFVVVFGLALAQAPEPEGNALGHGCISGGSSMDEPAPPGVWMKDLKDTNATLEGMNPNEIAELANEADWANGPEPGEAPNVGAMLRHYCGPDTE